MDIKRFMIMFLACVFGISIIWISIITVKRTDEKVEERTEYSKSSQISVKEATQKLKELEIKMEEVINNIGVMAKKEFIEKYESLELEQKKLNEELIRLYFSDNPKTADEEIKRFREEFEETFIESLKKEFGEEWFEYLKKVNKDY